MMFLDTVSLVVKVCLTPNLLDLYLLAFNIIVINSDSCASDDSPSLSNISCGLTLSILACDSITYAVDSAAVLLNPLLTKNPIAVS